MEPRREHWRGNEGGKLAELVGMWGVRPRGKTSWHRHHHHSGWEAQWVATKGGKTFRPQNNMAAKVRKIYRLQFDKPKISGDAAWIESVHCREEGAWIDLFHSLTLSQITKLSRWGRPGGKWLAEWFWKDAHMSFSSLFRVQPISTSFMACHLSWLMSCFCTAVESGPENTRCWTKEEYLQLFHHQHLHHPQHHQHDDQPHQDKVK